MLRSAPKALVALGLVLLGLGKFCFATAAQAAVTVAEAGQETTVQDTPAAARESTSSSPAISTDDIVVTAVGDVMLGTTFPDSSGASLPPNDGADLLTEVTPILKRGDVVFGNLEGPLIDGGTSSKCGRKLVNCFAFRVPTRYGTHLKAAGFTVMGLANNHELDFGTEGRASSRQVLDSLGIGHSGEIGDIAHLVAKGKRIDLIAFATYPETYNLLDLTESMQAVAQARMEADIVIVSFHGGAEGASHQHVPHGDEWFLGEDRGDLRQFTHAMIDAGADLVIGSGPHVVRAMEVYRGKLIAYSLGNFATYGPFNLKEENGLSLILEVHLGNAGSFRYGRAYPIRQEKPGGPKLDPAMSILPILRALSESDFPDSHIAIGAEGELYPPFAPDNDCYPDLEFLNQFFGLDSCGEFQVRFAY
jgi:poly-gamma-glutamate capsule biosynthesis protein CapA/YwtB (metallophosphatase superfamily)